MGLSINGSHPEMRYALRDMQWSGEVSSGQGRCVQEQLCLDGSTPNIGSSFDFFSFRAKAKALFLVLKPYIIPFLILTRHRVNTPWYLPRFKRFRSSHLTTTGGPGASLVDLDKVFRMVLFVHVRGERPFLSLCARFCHIDITCSKQIFSGTFRPVHLSKLGYGCVYRSASYV